MQRPATTDAPRFTARLAAPFAVLGIATDGRAVTRLAYLPRDDAEQAPADRVAEQAVREVQRYLVDPAFRFTVPLAPRGTAFQQRVWQALHAIPPGQSRTYGEVARMVRSAPRAIGQACGSNRIALMIPCHRVVAAQGGMGGFMHAGSGDPIAIKRWLLVHEGYRFGA